MLGLDKLAIGQAMEARKTTGIASLSKGLHIVLGEGLVCAPARAELGDGGSKRSPGVARVLGGGADDGVLGQQGAQRGVPLGGGRARDEGVVCGARGPAHAEDPVVGLLERVAQVNRLDARDGLELVGDGRKEGRGGVWGSYEDGLELE